MFQKVLKRIADLTLSFIGFVLLLPIFITIVILILLILGKPVFFIQQRAGKDGKPFHLIKFRTMINKTKLNGELLPDDQRTTNLGNFLRRYSIDEIPGFLNVMFGQISIVGPRPLLLEYNEFYSEKHKKRLTVLPGITGWAQINGRNNISWEEKFDLDVWYVENRSVVLDIIIIFKTIYKVFKSEDVLNQQGKTMSKFNGYENR